MPEQTRRIRLYSQDWQQMLFQCEVPEAVIASEAEQFLRDSGQTWLGCSIDYGPDYDWKTRRSGLVELLDDGTTRFFDSQDYLRNMLNWPQLGLLTPNPVDGLEQAARELAAAYGYHYAKLTDGTIVLEPPPNPNGCYCFGETPTETPR